MWAFPRSKRARDRLRARRRRRSPGGPDRRRDFAKRLDAALVALDRDHALCSVRKQRAREAARTRAHFDDGNALERSAGARDPAGEIEIEQEILAERLARRQAVPADHLAQRREFVDLRSFCRCRHLRLRKPLRELERGEQARRVRLAGAGEIERGPVIRGSADERQAERYIYRTIESERLHRREHLVVIHAERHVVAFARSRMEKRCRQDAGRWH